MSPARVATLLAAALLCVAAHAADKITTQVSGLPFEATEGTALSFTVASEVAQDLGTVPLHVEMKNRDNIVLAGETRQVSGSGKQEVAFALPMRDAQTEVNFAIWYGEDWREALVPIIHTEFVTILTAQQAAAVSAKRSQAEEWVAKMKPQLPVGGGVALLVDDLPGFDRGLAERVGQGLRGRGLPVIELTAEQVANLGILTADHFSTLVLTSSQVYPADGGRALERFARNAHSRLLFARPLSDDPQEVRHAVEHL